MRENIKSEENLGSDIMSLSLVPAIEFVVFVVMVLSVGWFLARHLSKKYVSELLATVALLPPPEREKLLVKRREQANIWQTISMISMGFLGLWINAMAPEVEDSTALNYLGWWILLLCAVNIFLFMNSTYRALLAHIKATKAAQLGYKPGAGTVAGDPV
jgi:hypothetical protein